jgi:hypothetical protein
MRHAAGTEAKPPQLTACRADKGANRANASKQTVNAVAGRHENRNVPSEPKVSARPYRQTRSSNETRELGEINARPGDAFVAMVRPALTDSAGNSGFGSGRRLCGGGGRIGRTVRAGRGKTQQASVLGRELQRRFPWLARKRRAPAVAGKRYCDGDYPGLRHRHHTTSIGSMSATHRE